MKKVSTGIAALERHTTNAREILRLSLRGLSPVDMIDKIDEWKLSDENLVFLSESIALETEDYEICNAVQVIEQRRRAKTSPTTL